MVSRFGSIFLSGIATISLFPLTAFAQTAQNQPDIVGLKIGMTFDQADSALKKYNQNIRILDLFRGADTTSDINQYPNNWPDIAESSGPAAFPDKVKIRVEQFAGVLTHAYDNKNNIITDQNNNDITTVSGEWFDLLFTPSNDGGRLYAIERTVVYPPPPQATDSTTLQNSLFQKYGQPSSLSPDPNDWTAFWMYDQRGRPIPSTNPDYARCQVNFTTNTSANFRLDSSVAAETIGDYNKMFSGISGSSLDDQDENRLSALFSQVYQFVPLIQPPTDPQEKLQYRNCGVQLAVQVWSLNSTIFTISLSDQNATYYDNGVNKYLSAKLLAVNGPPPATQQPGL